MTFTEQMSALDFFQEFENEAGQYCFTWMFDDSQTDFRDPQSYGTVLNPEVFLQALQTCNYSNEELEAIAEYWSDMSLPLRLGAVLIRVHLSN